MHISMFGLITALTRSANTYYQVENSLTWLRCVFRWSRMETFTYFTFLRWNCVTTDKWHARRVTGCPVTRNALSGRNSRWGMRTPGTTTSGRGPCRRKMKCRQCWSGDPRTPQHSAGTGSSWRQHMSGYLTLSFAGWERWVHVGTDDLWFESWSGYLLSWLNVLVLFFKRMAVRCLEIYSLSTENPQPSSSITRRTCEAMRLAFILSSH